MRRSFYHIATVLLVVLSACVEGRLPTESTKSPFAQLSDSVSTLPGPQGPDCWLISPQMTITYYAQCPATPVGTHEYGDYKVLWNRH